MDTVTTTAGQGGPLYVVRDNRKTNATGQLRGLEGRMSKHQLAKRAAKITARNTVAQSLYANQNELAAAVMGIFSVLKRGFFGRLKWLLVGR